MAGDDSEIDAGKDTVRVGAGAVSSRIKPLENLLPSDIGHEPRNAPTSAQLGTPFSRQGLGSPDGGLDGLLSWSSKLDQASIDSF